MIEKQIHIAEGQQLTLAEIASDLRLAGWEEQYVLVRLRDGGEQELNIDETEQGPRVRAYTSCEIFVPAGVRVDVGEAMGNVRVKELPAELTIGQVHGDCRLTEVRDIAVGAVHGNLKADALTSLRVQDAVHGDAKVLDARRVELPHVSGNLRVRDVDELHLDHVSGDLVVKDTAGPLAVRVVGGSAVLSKVEGLVTIDRVGGDLVAKELLGGARVSAGGNVVLSGELGSGCNYRFQAGGDALLNLASDPGAHLTLKAGGDIRSTVSLAETERGAGTLTGTLGNGGSEVVVEAGGNVVLGGKSVHMSWENEDDVAFVAGLGAEISRQVHDSLAAIDMAAIGRKANEEVERAMSRLQAKLETVDWERIGVQAQQAVERAMSQMQRDLDRLAEKTARQQEKVARMAQRAAERQQRRARFQEVSWQPGPHFHEPEPQPNLEEERLSILKMLEQGQVTLEEAEMLLEALR